MLRLLLSIVKLRTLVVAGSMRIVMGNMLLHIMVTDIWLLRSLRLVQALLRRIILNGSGALCIVRTMHLWRALVML